jgi:hypothetical protein
METAFAFLHVGLAAALIVAHALFFFRGLAIEARKFSPTRLDRLSRGLSQALLPVAALSGLILSVLTATSAHLLHLLLGLAPLAAIPAVFFGRLLVKRRTQMPWLLPAINLILLVAAAATGILIWR